MNHADAHSPISVKHKENLLAHPDLPFLHDGPLERFCLPAVHSFGAAIHPVILPVGIIHPAKRDIVPL